MDIYLAESTFPKKTSSTSAAFTPSALSKAPLIAWEPSWVADKDDKELQEENVAISKVSSV